MEDLSTSRQQINKLDQQLVKLLEERFNVVTRVSDYKRQHNLPVLDAKREQQVLTKVAALTNQTDLLPYLQEIYQEIMQRSREYQTKQRKD